jgi:hypothetical protein
MRDASVVRGIGVLPVFAGLIGLLLLVGSLAATWLREGRRRPPRMTGGRDQSGLVRIATSESGCPAQ